MTECVAKEGCYCRDKCPEGCYLREHHEPEYRGTNHDMTEDQRLDDPRHGQGDK